MHITIKQNRTESVIFDNYVKSDSFKKIIRKIMVDYTGHQLNVKLHDMGDHVAEFSIGNVITDKILFSIEYEED